MENIKAEISAVLDSFTKGLRDRDAAAVIALYAEDAKSIRSHLRSKRLPTRRD